MPKKKRTYNTRLIKRNYSYKYYEISELFGVSANVIPRWVKDGLRRIDDKKPYMIHGVDLADYLDAKQQARKKPCLPHEAMCFTCNAPRPFWESVVDITARNKKTVFISGLCALCDTSMNKIGSVSKIFAYQKIFKIQTVEAPDIIESANTSVKCDL